MKSDRDARLERLDDHLRGLGADPDAYEEDLFARAAAGTADELAFLDRLSAGIVDLVDRGTFEPWITKAEADALRARYGDAVAMLDLDLDHPERVEMPREAELVITRIAVDLRGIDRVDVEVVTLDGTPIKTMTDVRFDPGDGAVYACCEGDLARATVGPALRNVVWATRRGERRVLRELVCQSVLAG